MSETLTYAGKLTVVACWCGIRHAIPAELDDFQDRQHDNGQQQRGIYCPLGHSHIRAGDGEADKLRKQLASEKVMAASAQAALDQERASHSATKGKLTKERNRAKNGVCPVPSCHRSFVNVARHVATKHPGFEAP